MNALWFSRHAPTSAQLEEISAKGFTLCAFEEGTALGSIAIDGNLGEVIDALCDLVQRENAAAVFGVFPTPVLGYAFTMAKIYPEDVRKAVPLFASHNVSRTPEGAARPTFAHKAWVQVGVL